MSNDAIEDGTNHTGATRSKTPNGAKKGLTLTTQKEEVKTQPTKIIFDQKDKFRYVVRFEVCPYTGEKNRGLGVLALQENPMRWVYASWSSIGLLYLNAPPYESDTAQQALLKHFGQVKPYHTFTY